MTKVYLRMDDKNGILFDCINHAGDHDVCGIVTTLCNVLVIAADRAGYEPTTYTDGHVPIDVSHPSPDGLLEEVFETVWEVFRQASKQYPEHLKIDR